MLKFNSMKSIHATAVIGFIALTIGCAEPNSTAVNEHGSRMPAATAANPDAGSTPSTSGPLSDALVGTWLGQAMVDEEALEQKLAKLPADQQEIVFVVAENFLSTAMAMEFRTDGTVESEVEMKPLGGQPIRDNTVGQWRVTQISEDELAVEMAELDANGSTVVTKRTFHFYPDRDAFVMSVPVSSDLAGCDALMIFERQSSVANVALRPENVQR